MISSSFAIIANITTYYEPPRLALLNEKDRLATERRVEMAHNSPKMMIRLMSASGIRDLAGQGRSQKA